MNTFIQNTFNHTTTANGAKSYKSTLNACLDLFSMGVTSPNKQSLVSSAMQEDLALAIKTVIYLRDCRGGQGNKDIGRALYDKLITIPAYRKQFSQLLPLLVEVGSWKDIYNLYGASAHFNPILLDFISHALKSKDALAAKWFPRQSQVHKDLALLWKQDIGTVRRYVTSLTKVVETAMCNKQWHTINYEHVPSRANLVYSKAFLRNDNSRRIDFLNRATKGEATIKATTLYPHEITSKAQYDPSMEALWKALPNYMEGAEKFNILPIVDVSGSMETRISGSTSISCMDVAIGLGLYISERNTGAYKDIVCTFDSHPRFAKIQGNSLAARISNTKNLPWGGSTNLQATFDLILSNSISAAPEDLPKVILLISDMEFNSTDSRYTTNFEAIKAKYKAANIDMPTIVFWRVDTKQPQQPVTMHSTGAILINGYSPSFMSTVLSMDIDTLATMTPMNLFLQTVNNPRYELVDKIFSK